MSTNENELVRELLGSELMQNVIHELGLQDESPEEQADVIDLIDQRVMEHVTFEILKVLPRSEHEAFSTYSKQGEFMKLRELLAKHIPDLDRFLYEEALKEYEAVKTKMRELAEEV